MNDLMFAQLRTANLKRCEESFRPLHDWSPTDWGCALAGEAGEACNLLKKMLRGEDIPLEDVAKELGDIVTYTDLLAARLGIDLGAAVMSKFNVVSKRVGSDVTLEETRFFQKLNMALWKGSVTNSDDAIDIVQQCYADEEEGSR